ncbi:MAG: aminopeptidase P family protein [Chloroflexi bacterium]|nr:aminopeptidase P family protein [Chloroflexota bacterium]
MSDRESRVQAAQSFLQENRLDGWLLVDFHQNNPVFWQLIGDRRHTTRRAYLFIGPGREPRFLLHHVDANRLADLGWPIDIYRSLDEQVAGLRHLVGGHSTLAMEYSPLGALPVASRVDGGTLELVRSLGPTVVSSADLLQFVVARWTDAQLATHRRGVARLEQALRETFAHIAQGVDSGITEWDARQFMSSRFADLGLTTEDGPVVAVNEHTGDPHYEPTERASAQIARGDWLLIDFWARETTSGAVYGDMTWVGRVGAPPTDEQQRVFAVVREARDRAVAFLEQSTVPGEVQGWEVDRVARQVIDTAGYADAFTHRLGHSIGEQVHASGVNLDGFETMDTRRVIPGVAFSVEPGIYLPHFGVRLEINVYQSATGPEVTTPVQRDIVVVE